MTVHSGETAIVVPVYKQRPTRTEILSLSKCIQLLKAYPICFVAPKSLDLSVYQKLVAQSKTETFDEKYFNGLDGYNKLLLSRQFYDRFKKYKYMLIYQLDALIFNDNLEAWIKKDYDYIGAPWLKFPFMAFLSISLHVSIIAGLKLLWNKKLKIPVGNGGLSLRKIDSFRQALEENNELVSRWKANEDYFWSYFATVNGKPLRKPGIRESLNFSVETNPEKAFRFLNGKAPFGAHNWENHQKSFWDNYLWRINYFGDIEYVSTNSPKVSVITVAKEKRDLEKTLNSIRENRYGNIELIVINSSADHETYQLMKGNNPVISKWAWGSKNGNLYDDLNKGLSMATGEYVWIIKSGERIYYKSILNSIFKNQKLSDVYYGHSLLVDSKGSHGKKNRLISPKSLSWKNFPYNRSISSGAIIAKRELVPLFDTSLAFFAELDWQINVLKRANKVEFTGYVLDAVSGEGGRNIDIAFLKERYQIVKSNYGALRSAINQTIALTEFLFRYLRYGKLIFP